ncbi:otubain [Trifolium pratense]|uniref:Otubain n=1 Tax=Trifolium pratense TaxID=57577 RepID=A0A2K3N8V6_TRIPR|nr:otubain [Trifolium pratense]
MQTDLTSTSMEDAPADLRPNNIAEPVVDSLDFAKNFATDDKFSTRDDLLKWVRGEALKLGFAIIIAKSDNGSDTRKQTLVLGCERGGVYRKRQKKLKGQDRRTIKCDDVPNEGHPDISLTEEWEAIQVRFNNADYNTKIHMKEQLRQIAFPETTSLCPPAEKENENLPFSFVT